MASEEAQEESGLRMSREAREVLKAYVGVIEAYANLMIKYAEVKSDEPR